MEPPAERFELLLAQPIAIPRGWRGVIRRAVAFDRQYEAPGSCRMRRHHVDAIARAADLSDDMQLLPRQLVEDRLLEFVEPHIGGNALLEAAPSSGRVFEEAT